MPLYDYRCEDGHVTESREGVDITTIPCPTCCCKQGAYRVPVYYDQYLSGGPTTGPSGPPSDGRPCETDYRRDFADFNEANEEVEYQYQKAEEEVGQPLPRPDLWQKAKEQVRENFREGQIRNHEALSVTRDQ